MAFRYVVKKRVFGFDKSKSEKYVPLRSPLEKSATTDCATRLRRRVWLRAAL